MRSSRYAIPAGLALVLLSGCGQDPEVTPEGTGSAASRVFAPSGRSDAHRNGEANFLTPINEDLRRRGMGLAVAKAEFLVQAGREDAGRTVFVAEHFDPYRERWVPGDARRLAQGDAITYMVLQEYGTARPGISAAETEAAIDRSFVTWAAASSCARLDVVKRPDTGVDATLLDYYVGMGGMGDPFQADVVEAGFWPGEFFDRLYTDGSQFILGVTFTLVFTDDLGYPTDVDRDRSYDTALAEVYYNNEFMWSTTGTGIDIETVALHENGHTLGLGHFGNIFRTEANGTLHAAPHPVMLAAYVGPHRELENVDIGALCRLYGNRR